MWSLIIFFILYHSVGPLYLNGATMSPIIKCCLGGPGGQLQLYGVPPPLAGGFGGSAPEAKKKLKFPCKRIVISSQSRPFIRKTI